MTDFSNAAPSAKETARAMKLDQLLDGTRPTQADPPDLLLLRDLASCLRHDMATRRRQRTERWGPLVAAAAVIAVLFFHGPAHVAVRAFHPSDVAPIAGQRFTTVSPQHRTIHSPDRPWQSGLSATLATASPFRAIADRRGFAVRATIFIHLPPGVLLVRTAAKAFRFPFRRGLAARPGAILAHVPSGAKPLHIQYRSFPSLKS